MRLVAPRVRLGDDAQSRPPRWGALEAERFLPSQPLRDFIVHQTFRLPLMPRPARVATTLDNDLGVVEFEREPDHVALAQDPGGRTLAIRSRLDPMTIMASSDNPA